MGAAAVRGLLPDRIPLRRRRRPATRVAFSQAPTGGARQMARGESRLSDRPRDHLRRRGTALPLPSGGAAGGLLRLARASASRSPTKASSTSRPTRPAAPQPGRPTVDQRPRRHRRHAPDRGLLPLAFPLRRGLRRVEQLQRRQGSHLDQPDRGAMAGDPARQLARSPRRLLRHPLALRRRRPGRPDLRLDQPDRRRLGLDAKWGPRAGPATSKGSPASRPCSAPPAT